MSQIYIKEPATSGKVLLVTTRGDIDVELWCKETPKACRNFIQLCMEGYYDGTIFHRLVPDFIVQGGDPTGTGEGGESIYGKPFADEFHQRLRFTRRGLLGMASAGENDCRSQFFFTLGPTEELTGKHTLFGKVGGPTLFNMLRLGEGEVGENDVPDTVHKILRTEILNNPFGDIVPRQEIREERETTERARAKAQQRRAKRKQVKAVKNFGLMSFGEEAEEEEKAVLTAAVTVSSGTSRIKSSHDLLAVAAAKDKRRRQKARHVTATTPDKDAAQVAVDHPNVGAIEVTPLSPPPIVPPPSVDNEHAPASSTENDHSSVARHGDGDGRDAAAHFDAVMRAAVLRQQAARGVKVDLKTTANTSTDATTAPKPPLKLAGATPEERLAASEREAAELRAALREGRRKRKQSESTEDGAQVSSRGRKPSSDASSYLRNQLSQYGSHSRGDGSKRSRTRREDDTMAMLGRFQSKLAGSAANTNTDTPSSSASAGPIRDDGVKGVDGKAVDYGSAADEEARGWLSHHLRDDSKDYSRGIDPEMDPNSLDLYDPRNPLTERRRQANNKVKKHSHKKHRKHKRRPEA